MEIFAEGKYARHAALFAALLRIPGLRVKYEGGELDASLKAHYRRTASIVKSETGFDLQASALERACVASCDVRESAVRIDCSRNFREAEQKLASAVSGAVDLSAGEMLKNSIRHLLGRPPSIEEIAYHTSNNREKNIDLFVWICVLNACPEAFERGYREFFSRSQGPRVAILLAGYVRNSKHASHAPIIEYSNADVFVHTWDDIGLKNGRRLIDKKWIAEGSPPTDAAEIERIYRPCDMRVESNASKLDEFSIVGRIRPIFLYAGQARDDATRYINSQLYSIHRAYEMMCEKERKEGFRYHAILRMRFDFEVRSFSWTGILEDVARGGVYFPHAACNNHRHAGGGGGCVSCDAGVEHARHSNDLCDLWFYGSRDEAAKACEVYLRSYDIAKDHHEENLRALESQNAYHEDERGFVYVSKTMDIETKFVCFYPERLLREHLAGTPCRSSRRITGKI